jgi:Tfp pilus assembly protein PilN
MNRNGAPQIVEVEFLPPDQRRGEVAPLVVILTVLCACALIAIFPLSARSSAARHDAHTAQAQADDAEQRLTALQLDLVQQRALRNELDDAQKKLNAIVEQRQQLQGGKRPLADDLAIILTPWLVPAQARITAITGTAGGLRVAGLAADPLDVLAYAGKLAHDGGFQSASVVSFAPDAGGAGKFEIEVTR